ncbi:MAG: PepSY domain-containing protein [Chitinophagaceae bacterium]|nr:PepSY domain-containing protein [Chitinophagaceae bacterium]MBK7557707.1 PepSY domain-containing protein [Chitinophagaceae bacterium]MBK9531381.1 PepSY domain-containing protein [Chitinophagaceae bacterium]HQW92475.1 PepSY-associated TM helix domain-containing protein [Ferruginibacter sp.]
MTTKNSRYYKPANLIRVLRKIHRTIAIFLFAFFLVVSVTGLLLGWKKNSGGLILPPSSTGISKDLKTWLPIDSLRGIAVKALHDSVSAGLSDELERIDARPQKGMVKFVFADDYWEIQLDGTTGKVLLVERRRSDIIENIHDGTILDVLFNTENDQFKLSYTTIMGLSLLMLTISGFWLWYGPKRLRKQKRIAQ